MTSSLTRRRLRLLGLALMVLGIGGVVAAWIEPDQAEVFFALAILMVVLGIYCRVAARML